MNLKGTPNKKFRACGVFLRSKIGHLCEFEEEFKKILARK
jgi:hypothetical protein